MFLVSKSIKELKNYSFFILLFFSRNLIRTRCPWQGRINGTFCRLDCTTSHLPAHACLTTWLVPRLLMSKGYLCSGRRNSLGKCSSQQCSCILGLYELAKPISPCIPGHPLPCCTRKKACQTQFSAQCPSQPKVAR